MEAFCLAIESGGFRTSLDTSLGVQKPRSVHDFQGKPALFDGKLSKHLHVSHARHR